MTRRRPGDDAGEADRVTVVGGDRLTVPATGAPPSGFSRATVDERLRCSTGEAIDGPWTGIPVEELLAAADTPDDATHVLVTGRDGFRVCVDVAAVRDGVLALRRGPADAGKSSRDVTDDVPTDAGLPRFVSPAVTGTRAVRDVARIEAVRLDAGDDPETYEDLRLGDRDGS